MRFCRRLELSSKPVNLRWQTRTFLMPILLSVVAMIGTAQVLAPSLAHAKPAPDIEYMYDVTVRRAYHWPNNDPLAYGYLICDRVSRGEGYPQVMSEVKAEITSNDEFAANYLVSNAVDLLCPDQIQQLRDSAVYYRPPAGA